MKLIKTTGELNTFCNYASRSEFVTIDNENRWTYVLFGSHSSSDEKLDRRNRVIDW